MMLRIRAAFVQFLSFKIRVVLPAKKKPSFQTRNTHSVTSFFTEYVNTNLVYFVERMSGF